MKQLKLYLRVFVEHFVALFIHYCPVIMLKYFYQLYLGSVRMRKIVRTYFPKTWAFFVLVALLAVAIFAVYALLDHVRVIFFSHTDTQNQSVVSLTANMVDERINSRLIHLQTLAYIPSSSIRNTSNKKLLSDKLAQIKTETSKLGYNFIQLTDAQGISVSSGGKEIKITETEHFYKAIRGFTTITQIIGNNSIDLPYKGKEGMIILNVPIFSGANVYGVLTAAIDSNKFDILQDIDIPYSGASLFLIDRNHRILARSGESFADILKSGTGSPFLSLISSMIGPEELDNIKHEINSLIGNTIRHYKSNRNGQILSFANLPSSAGWKLVAVSSERSIRSQQNSLIYKIGILFLLITFLISMMILYVYIVNWKYKRIRDLSRAAIDMTGSHFFRFSETGDVKDYEKEFASFLGVPADGRIFNLRQIMDDDQNIFPMDKINGKTSFKLYLKNEYKMDVCLLVQVIGKQENGFYPAFAMDVTKDEQMQKKIRDLAYVDVIANIPNRESFILKVESLNEKCLKKSFKSGLLFVDINNSHKILEIFGHRLFQNMIRESASRLSSISEEAKGNVYNLGGDDFVIVIDDYDNNVEMLDIADKISKKFACPFMLGDASFEVSCRVGIVSCPEYQTKTQITPSDMLRYGEITVRLAKANNDLFILDMESYLSVINELDMEMDLVSSIKNKELKLKYQPIYSYGLDRITAFEALLRWESKKHGKVPPCIFIPMAEKCGFINQLGDFVIETSLDFAAKLRSQQKIMTVNLNVSPIQFLQLNFAEKLILKFRESLLPEKSIGIEITESYLFENMVDLSEKLDLIRRAGITISVDDFGTGYSSLSYLKDLPIDYLKIDRSFIIGIETSEKHIKLIKGVIDLAKSLGLDVIAEGIETEDQLNTVLRCGCNNIQGFYIARPMDEENAAAFINSFEGIRR